ncbi:MAG: hypothetical protein ILO42_08655 [Clostridia bacterium]|nr:hypothetical protein [Clostridia bacterium]
MPLPLVLGIAAAVAAAGGIGGSVHGAVKMKGAHTTVKSTEERHNKNIQRFETCNARTSKSMDDLGKTELGILASFQEFSDIIEQIQNCPDFAEFTCDSVELPQYDREAISKVSVGAGVLMGGISGAAMGTAGGFAAAGATTAAVMALGTASTGTAIASLSGVAATNATLAALGGGAIAAGGGGMALGSTMLGVTSAGIGMLVGGIIFSITGTTLSKKADKAYKEMLEAEAEINLVCAYLNKLNMIATRYYSVMGNVEHVYRRHLNALDAIVNINKKTDWLEFTPQERLVTQNTVLLVQLLYKMCQVQLVIKAEKENEVNSVNKADVDDCISAANALVNERGFEIQQSNKPAGWRFDEQESYCIVVAALLYYFAGCDNNVSNEEAAVIKGVVTPILDPEIVTDEMVTEISLIDSKNPFTFDDLTKYLAYANVESLVEFSALIEQVIGASDGITKDEKEAKAKFESYVKERKKGN